jgi:hypothetical protein
VLWLAVLLAASPLLIALPDWLGERPESAHVLVAPLLFGLAAWRRGSPPTRRGRIAGAVALVVAPLPIALGSDLSSPTLGLGGLALGLVGAALFTGRPAWPAPLLALWLVPPPLSLLDLFTPELESFWMQVAHGVLEPLGVPLERVGPVAHGPGGARLEVFAEDCGLVLAHGFALVGATRALEHGATAFRLARCAGAFALAGLALQGPVVLVANGWLSLGHEALAGATLDVLPAAIVVLGVAWALWTGTTGSSDPRQASRAGR